MSKENEARHRIWRKMVNSSKSAIEDFNDFNDDKAVVWADNQIKNYRRAMMILIESNNNFDMNLSDEDSDFIQTMKNRAY